MLDLDSDRCLGNRRPPGFRFKKVFRDYPEGLSYCQRVLLIKRKLIDGWRRSLELPPGWKLGIYFALRNLSRDLGEVGDGKGGGTYF